MFRKLRNILLFTFAVGTGQKVAAQTDTAKTANKPPASLVDLKQFGDKKYIKTLTKDMEKNPGKYHYFSPPAEEQDMKKLLGTDIDRKVTIIPDAHGGYAIVREEGHGEPLSFSKATDSLFVNSEDEVVRQSRAVSIGKTALGKTADGNFGMHTVDQLFMYYTKEGSIEVFGLQSNNVRTPDEIKADQETDPNAKRPEVETYNIIAQDNKVGLLNGKPAKADQESNALPQFRKLRDKIFSAMKVADKDHSPASVPIAGDNGWLKKGGVPDFQPDDGTTAPPVKVEKQLVKAAPNVPSSPSKFAQRHLDYDKIKQGGDVAKAELGKFSGAENSEYSYVTPDMEFINTLDGFYKQKFNTNDPVSLFKIFPLRYSSDDGKLHSRVRELYKDKASGAVITEIQERTDDDMNGNFGNDGVDYALTINAGDVETKAVYSAKDKQLEITQSASSTKFDITGDDAWKKYQKLRSKLAEDFVKNPDATAKKTASDWNLTIK